MPRTSNRRQEAGHLVTMTGSPARAHAWRRMDYGQHCPASLRRSRHSRWSLRGACSGKGRLDSRRDDPRVKHAFIDSTVVNVALPALQSALHATLAEVQWVVESYALFLAALLLIGGSLGDLYGRRKIFVIGVVTFTAASVWCGLSRTIDQLIVARGLQGIGGALLVPGSLALISVNF